MHRNNTKNEDQAMLYKAPKRSQRVFSKIILHQKNLLN